MAHLGIDLGTSNTLVALVTAQGNPEIQRIEGEPMVPSFIYMESDGANPIIGKGALDEWAEPDHDPKNSYRHWKTSLGEVTLDTGSSSRVTPEDLTTMMVEYIVKQISDGIGGEPVESVLVTVPHGWRRQTPEKCRLTREAAARAQVGGKPVMVKGITVSEPVAAAAYWIWEHQRNADISLPGLIGEVIFVCDVGGGTFDLSLVKVGGPDRPLDVVDASNIETAGDVADALLCAWVCQQFNGACGTTHPDTAEAVLAAVSHPDPSYLWLRKWLLQAQEMKKSLSMRILREKDPNKIRATTVSFTDNGSHHHDVRFELQDFWDCLEPFFQQGRDLVRRFLKNVPTIRPYAVIFCGGGSKIAGVRERIVAPVLEELYGADEAAAILTRINVNIRRVDEAIALGAALIANDLVTVQERLLHDVGIVMKIDNALLAKELGLGQKNKDFLLTPVLKKGVTLPAAISNRDLGLIASVQPQETLDIEVVIDDDLSDPLIQKWKVPHPGGRETQSLDWEIEIDTDGELLVQLMSPGGNASSVTGRLKREVTGSNRPIIGPRDTKITWPRISPERLKKSIDALDRGK